MKRTYCYDGELVMRNVSQMHTILKRTDYGD